MGCTPYSPRLYIVSVQKTTYKQSMYGTLIHSIGMVFSYHRDFQQNWPEFGDGHGQTRQDLVRARGAAVFQSDTAYRSRYIRTELGVWGGIARSSARESGNSKRRVSNRLLDGSIALVGGEEDRRPRPRAAAAGVSCCFQGGARKDWPWRELIPIAGISSRQQQGMHTPLDRSLLEVVRLTSRKLQTAAYLNLFAYCRLPDLRPRRTANFVEK
jgi:hypothetical protein